MVSLRLLVGVDVGSTTVKAAVVDANTSRILWRDYRRHHTRQAQSVREMLAQIEKQFSTVARECIRVFVTGSGAGPLVKPIGARFVQEVNAVTFAAEQLYPDVGSVIELGGQDAKIIVFRRREDGSQGQPITSMNDKCASGTGATIDKCVIKAGTTHESLATLVFNPTRLHHVAAKCGVFAETDVVSLLKNGIPTSEIMNSLADAIVGQNLSVLARGNMLRPTVLLLGGPNTFLPFLQSCWRYRIRELWDEREYDYPRGVPIEELVKVPDNSQYFAAYGAVLYGAHEPNDVGVYRGIEPLDRFIEAGRTAQLSAKAGPPLAHSEAEVADFKANYAVPAFLPMTFARGDTVHAVIGLDGGSTSSKCVLVGQNGELLAKEYTLSGGNPIQDTKELFTRLRAQITQQGVNLNVTALGVTGYAGDVMAKTLRADANVVETVAHMMSAVHHFGDIDVICDIGGQDIKVLFLRNGDIRNFRLSNQCSAGNGMLLQTMADQFGMPLGEYAESAFKAGLSPKFSYGCAVFLDSDRVNFQKEGFNKEELLAGLALVLPKNIWQYVVQIPRMVDLGTRFVLQGGTQHNLAAVKAQVGYIKERVSTAEVFVHPHPGEAGAIGAALEALRVVERRGYSTFVGLDAATELQYTATNDASTRCSFCANNCARTFVDTETPDGQRARYITGFSCEKGTVEDLEALRELNARRRVRAQSAPNLVQLEARLCFKRVYTPRPLPDEGTTVDDTDVVHRFLRMPIKRMYRRSFRRSSREAQLRRHTIRIGMPRVLNMWSTGPFWRAYFETLGVHSRNVVFSDETSEDMWKAGSRYGSVDPCFPAKVCQAHIHNLLFTQHAKRPLNYIFFPCVTHTPSFIEGGMDSTTCPVVAGTPKVVRAAFAREIDFFATRKIEYIDTALTLVEPTLLKRQLFEPWTGRLGVTEDESDFAVEEGFRALRAFDEAVQERGRMVLEKVERDNSVAILVIGRPYHADPGLNHNIFEEFQALGYPILSIRSLPKDGVWLEGFFADDLKQGYVKSPLDITDVWPEHYSANSVHKVWAAKFAARHPNIAVLDLSSFKCGHDAPTYGLIDRIIAAGHGPYAALHDLDANKPTGSINIRIRTYDYNLRRYREELEERRRIGLPASTPEHWHEAAHDQFTAAQRDSTTVLHCGLTVVHDLFIQSALRGMGYRVQALDTPDNEALQRGKEYGNRGQCNPTYFTVGNLIKFLEQLRTEGLSSEEIITRYIFVTAGACGPCRFGTYVTEYRKALRDAGFDGFRVLLFQQTGGLKQATGADIGLRFDSRFFLGLVRAIVVGDILNALGYRMRPYEVEAGATDKALDKCKSLIVQALEKNGALWAAMWRCRKALAGVNVDRTLVKPKVAIIGEFWAMTTEGDGNYRVQRFLEEEGAEVEVQPVAAWLSYMIWQSRFDTRRRAQLRDTDGGRHGLDGVNISRRLILLRLAEGALHGLYGFYAFVMGLHRFKLPDMEEIATVSHAFYDNDLRGGEGHMEVGKLLVNICSKKANMTLSVKPFGCMPSGAVSDGVQTMITELYPEGIFQPVETTGDGAVNVYSRIQMQLFKARQAALNEVESALQNSRMTHEEVRAYVQAHPGIARAHQCKSHHVACTTANLVYKIVERGHGRHWPAQRLWAWWALRKKRALARTHLVAMVRAAARKRALRGSRGELAATLSNAG